MLQHSLKLTTTFAPENRPKLPPEGNETSSSHEFLGANYIFVSEGHPPPKKAFCSGLRNIFPSPNPCFEVMFWRHFGKVRSKLQPLWRIQMSCYVYWLCSSEQ